jgi:hypothetical protein
MGVENTRVLAAVQSGIVGTVEGEGASLVTNGVCVGPSVLDSTSVGVIAGVAVGSTGFVASAWPGRSGGNATHAASSAEASKIPARWRQRFTGTSRA